MKKIKSLILTILVALSTVILAGNVNAADLGFGKPNKEVNNIVKVPVELTVGENETVSNVKFECELSTLEDATCTVEKGSDVISKDGMYVPSNGQAFESGKTVVATLVLTNNSSNALNTVPLSLKNASIDGTSKSVSTTVTIGAKAQERTKSKNSKFTKVSFSKGTISPNFSGDITSYTVYNIPDTINSVTLSYECENCDTTDIVGGKSVSGYKIYLNEGENDVQIGCISEDGTDTTTYKFKIIRGETTYNSAKLKSLSFDGFKLNPEFDKDVKEYTITIPNRTTNLVNAIEYEAEDKAANVDVKGLDNYVVGENKLTITVDNANGDETITYTVTVKRMSEEEIEVTKYKYKQVTFKNAEGVETTLSEDDFKAQYPEEYENITNGTYEFDKDGNRVYETEKEELDEDKKEEKKTSNKAIRVIIIVVIGIIIIGVAGFFIFKKKKPSKNAKEETENKEEAKEEKVETETTEEKEESTEDEEEPTQEIVIKKEVKREYTAEETMNIDEALSDLMSSTKQYNFKDEDDK